MKLTYAVRIFGCIFVTLAACSASAQTATESVLTSLSLTSQAPPVQARDGNLYVAQDSDFTDGGAITASQLITGTTGAAYNFAGGTDGGIPESPAVQGPDGAIYGAAGYGGANNWGVIYKLTLSAGVWTESVLYNFTGGDDGCYPESAVIFDNAGNLYGMTGCGGQYSGGTAYKFTPSTSTFTVLHAFCQLTNCTDGGGGKSGLVQASNGDFYGIATQAAYAHGGIFQLTPSGGYTLLYSFCAGGGGCTDGAGPQGPLVEAGDGNLYGVTYDGGANGNGSLYQVTTGGSLTTIYNFIGAPDGAGVEGPLVVGSDGNLYGATVYGGDSSCGNNGCGSSFKSTTAGVLTVLADFSDPNSAGDDNPYSGPMQASDGNIYGATEGLVDGYGAIYEISFKPALPAPIQLSFSPATVAPGSQTTLSWKGLNTFSTTLQECYAFIEGSATGAGTWTGQQIGAYNATTEIYSGSAKITPTAKGTYTYALTCGGIESGSATLTVASSKDTSSTTLVPSPNPVDIGQSVKLTATVTGMAGDATPTGNVAFIYDGDTLATVAVNGSGVASFSASTNGLTAGTYVVYAQYAGDTNYDLSASSNINVTLKAGPTTTALKASANPVTPPATETLTATVKRAASGATGTPTGTVTFSVATTVLGTAKLNSSGVATFSAPTTGQPAGTYPVVAKYTGDASDVASSSSAVDVVVK